MLDEGVGKIGRQAIEVAVREAEEARAWTADLKTTASRWARYGSSSRPTSATPSTSTS